MNGRDGHGRGGCSAVFVLREVFGFGFSEVASAVGRSVAACRQLAVRARRHMDGGTPSV